MTNATADVRGGAGDIEDARGLFRFAAAFGLIWAAYDALDLYWHGTIHCAFGLPTPGDAPAIAQLRVLQISLLLAETVLVAVALRGPRARGAWWGLRAAAALACTLRGYLAYAFFGLNDFLYYTVTAFVLAQSVQGLAGVEWARAWPRRLLRHQTAWIYFATGLLKLNPHWLSGEHLWVRTHYLAEALRWPLPGWLAQALGTPGIDHWLAIGGAMGELTLAALLVFGAPRWLAVALAVAMHGFAALALNVWFFGASMVAQVAYVARRPKATPEVTRELTRRPVQPD